MTNERLSPRGEIRRQQILLLAQAHARRRRRGRLRRRGGAVILLALVTGAVLWPRHHSGGPLPVAVARVQTPTTAPSIVPLGIVVQYVQTDPSIADRLTLPPQKPRWTSIDDQQLLDELAAAGQPGGIVSMNGKTMLLLRPAGEQR